MISSISIDTILGVLPKCIKVRINSIDLTDTRYPDIFIYNTLIEAGVPTCRKYHTHLNLADVSLSRLFDLNQGKLVRWREPETDDLIYEWVFYQDYRRMNMAIHSAEQITEMLKRELMLKGSFTGLKFYDNDLLPTELKEVTETIRFSFKERWIDPILHPVTKSFEPWVRSKKVTKKVQVPSRSVYMVGSDLIMHSSLRKEIFSILKGA